MGIIRYTMLARRLAVPTLTVLLMMGCESGDTEHNGHESREGSDERIVELTRSLASTSKSVRAAAMDDLVHIGDEAIPRLREVLGSPALVQRVSAAQALARIGEPAASALLVGMDDADHTELDMIGYSLSRMRETAVAPIKECLRGSHTPDAEVCVLVALSEIGPSARHAGSEISAKILSDHPAVSFNAMVTLAGIGDTEAVSVDAIVKLLERDEDPRLVVPACRLLARLGSVAKPAVPTLERLARSFNEDVASEARSALRACGE